MHTHTRRLASLLLTAAMLASSLSFATTAMAVTDATFYITGRGWGHGIGLSQYGARELAKRVDPATGRLFTADGIIRYYYGNTSRTRAEAVSTKWVSVRLDSLASASNLGYTKTYWTLRAGNSGSRLLVKASNLPSAGVQMPLDDLYKFSVTSGGISITRGTESFKPAGVAVLTGTVTVSEAGSASTKLVQVVERSGLYDQAYCRYRESLQLSSNGSKLKLINRINIENYLYGVVPREMPASWGDASSVPLQAQSIAARSYAFTTTGELYCTTSSQAYQGHSSGSDRSATKRWEDDRTNSAIDATRGKVARYHWSDGGIDIIRTYFSSTSGGYTANIQDVWTSSSPQPFYKGVADPDISSPYHSSWGSTPISLTGTQFAAKLRARSTTAGQTEPLPHFVTGVVITRASNGSGYAVRATTSWSNGAKHTHSGDSMRSALGLKSTKFSIGKGYVPKPPAANGVPPVPPLKRVESSRTELSFTGPWTTTTSSSLSGGSRRLTNKKDSWLVTKFTGKSVRWIATRGTAYGRAAVYIDGTLRKAVDLYSSKSLYRQVAFSDFGLAEGEHTMEIHVVGSKSAASAGTYVCVDAIDVGIDDAVLQASPPVRRIDDTSTALAWTGTWSTSSPQADNFGGQYSFTNTPGAKYYAAFSGSGFDWIGASSTRFGMAKVTIDQRPPVVVDTYTLTTERARVLYSVRDLPLGPHTVTIEVLGQKRAEGEESYVSVDAFETHGGIPSTARPPLKLVDDAHAPMVFSGTWKARTVSGRYYNTEHYSAVKGARMQVQFDGNAVTIRGARSSSGGRANVYVDGRYKQTIDVYSSTTKLKQVLFTSSNIGSGIHTLRLDVLGTHRSGASSSNVFVDAVEVWGVPVAP